MNNDDSILKEQLLAKALGDKIAQYCLEEVYNASEFDDEDFSHYDVLQNALGYAAKRILASCFGKSEDDLQQYAPDFIEVIKSYFHLSDTPSESLTYH